jgi:putative ABC transport system permease protein
MRTSIIKIVLKSISYYRKPVFYQFIIIALLSAIITGSLLTGFSVRQSLIKSAETKLGSTGIIISSGLRYFPGDLAKRFSQSTGIKSTPVLEINGFCQNLNSGTKSLNINIYGIESDFFGFHGIENLSLKPGEAAINKSLADKLKISQGDEVSVNFRQLNDIPSNSPFAPSSENRSLVIRAEIIITPDQLGNFSLGISQLTPDNIFINIDEFGKLEGFKLKMNRILVREDKKLTPSEASKILKMILLPEDIGLKIRNISPTDETEMVSSRIFLDQGFFDETKKSLPSCRPVITYLANSFSFKGKTTPYSFVAGIEPSNPNDIQPGNSIIINRWLADDLNATVNDSVTLTWFTPGRISELEEKSEKFYVSKIVEQKGIFSDSLLMPEFPGMAGKESCSEWDAGVKIKMDRIRKKDENYWKEFRGTPKAFLSYEKGKALWGNNFGPLTAIRFSPPVKVEEIRSKLKGNLDPEKCGFTVKNIKTDMVIAAKESVDFTTLFISLGFFLILACIILLLLNVNAFFDSRKKQISTLFALGFNNRWINLLLFYETGSIAFFGSATGAFFGILVNWLIINALNSVWIGAVQTDNLIAFTGINILISGYIISFLLTLIFMFIRLRGYTKNLDRVRIGAVRFASPGNNRKFLFISAFFSLTLIGTLLFSGSKSPAISFSAGISVFITMILIWRQYLLRGITGSISPSKDRIDITGKYFAYYPSHAIAPILFIAAGLFSVIITGINRLEISERNLGPSGGTGGYLLWIETAIPVKEDLNSKTGRNNFGLNDSPGKDLIFIQARRTNGDDASCLNLNHITSPPLLGIDPEPFIRKGSFSFSNLIPSADKSNPWAILKLNTSGNIIYGVADQTVLEWGLKKKTGDTLKIKTESGDILNIIIAGGLKSSVLQGYVVISDENSKKYFPSIPGNSVFLAEGENKKTDTYLELLNNRFENYGISVLTTRERLSSFFRVTNTYLSVFTILGGLGMILGIIGLGFVLKRNYILRKREFALLMATGLTDKAIRKIVLKEQIFILFAGLLTGIISPLVATLPSIENGSDIPWLSLSVISVLITLIGLLTLFNSVRSVNQDSLITCLRGE